MSLPLSFLLPEIDYSTICKAREQTPNENILIDAVRSYQVVEHPLIIEQQQPAASSFVEQPTNHMESPQDELFDYADDLLDDDEVFA